ncbi:MAG: DUF6544 family protein [Pseudomonadota bacterium]
MVEDLPEPAKRFFLFTIKKGTPLHAVAEISMRGRFGIGSRTKPNYTPFRAKQVLAAPEGFMWRMSGGSGVLRISGSDSARWTRFWLAGLVPVTRRGGTTDHTLSAFGRTVSEAVFWTPAAVLPRPGVTWEGVNDTTARLTVAHRGMRQSVDLTVDDAGRPTHVVLQRWSDANAEADYRFQPFGGDLSAFREVQGFVLPTHIEAGNFYGTESYFPFFIADVTDMRFR